MCVNKIYLKPKLPDVKTRENINKIRIETMRVITYNLNEVIWNNEKSFL